MDFAGRLPYPQSHKLATVQKDLLAGDAWLWRATVTVDDRRDSVVGGIDPLLFAQRRRRGEITTGQTFIYAGPPPRMGKERQAILRRGVVCFTPEYRRRRRNTYGKDES